jgi:hypothetical protein
VKLFPCWRKPGRRRHPTARSKNGEEAETVIFQPYENVEKEHSSQPSSAPRISWTKRRCVMRRKEGNREKEKNGFIYTPRTSMSQQVIGKVDGLEKESRP